jgi:hypothetical protein
MRTSRLHRTALPLAALLTASCATLQRFESSETERLLAAAGFEMRSEETDEGSQALRTLPSHRVVRRTADGRIVYSYVDPDRCRCVYVGGEREYAAYERLARTPPIGRGSSPSGGAVGGAP